MTFEGFKPGSPNFANKCILGIYRLRLCMVEFNLDLQDYLGSKWSKSVKNRLVLTITFEGLSLGSPNIWTFGAWIDLRWDCILCNLTMTFKVIFGQKGQNLQIVRMKTTLVSRNITSRQSLLYPCLNTPKGFLYC